MSGRKTAEINPLGNTTYYNSTGLPADGHLTSARDISVLTRRIIDDFPEYYHWYSQKSYKYNDIEQFNRNKLLWSDKTVDGVKTGHTDSAGYCLVSSARRGVGNLCTSPTCVPAISPTHMSLSLWCTTSKSPLPQHTNVGAIRSSSSMTSATCRSPACKIQSTS